MATNDRTAIAGLLMTPTITNSGASSNITNPTGLYVDPTFNVTATLTNVYGILVDTIGSTGTITNVSN